jgi:hypothetical protein
MSVPVSAQSLVVAAGLEDEAAFLPLVVERFERQVRALRRLAALEGLLAAQAMDIHGDRPSGVPWRADCPDPPLPCTAGSLRPGLCRPTARGRAAPCSAASRVRREVGRHWAQSM